MRIKVGPLDNDIAASRYGQIHIFIIIIIITFLVLITISQPPNAVPALLSQLLLLPVLTKYLEKTEVEVVTNLPWRNHINDVQYSLALYVHASARCEADEKNTGGDFHFVPR